jgi:hypothetical protein
MIKNSSTQTGSAHVVIIIILVIALVGALGFVFWKNFSPSQEQPEEQTSSSDQPIRQSGLVVLEDGDMNKYVDYENNLEFLVPKQIYTRKDCKELDTRRDNFGNTIPSELHYQVSSGPVSVTVFKSGNEYIIAPDKTAILSNPKGTQESGYIYQTCDVVDTTKDLIIEADTIDLAVKNLSVEHNSFKVENAADKNAAQNAARTFFSSPLGTVKWTLDPADNSREMGEFTYNPAQSIGGFAYKLWYYPEQKKVVFISLGQGLSFEHPDGSDQFYLSEVVDSFKLSTN